MVQRVCTLLRCQAEMAGDRAASISRGTTRLCGGCAEINREKARPSLSSSFFSFLLGIEVLYKKKKKTITHVYHLKINWL